METGYYVKCVGLTPIAYLGCPCNEGSAARGGDICFAKM